MSEKLSFVLYTDLGAHLDKLTNEDAGLLFKAIFKYQTDGLIPDLSPAADMLFGVICSQIDRESKKWETVRAKRVEAANARYKKHRDDEAEDANASISMQMHANAAVPVPVPAPVPEDVPVSVPVPVINNTDPAPTPTPTPEPRKAWGVFGHVHLSEGELVEWQTERPKDWEAKLTRLDEFLERNPERIRYYEMVGHLKKLREWAAEDDKKSPKPPETSVHFENEKKNKGYNNDSIFPDLFSDEIDDYLKGGQDEGLPDL